jgi:hypothetical protein
VNLPLQTRRRYWSSWIMGTLVASVPQTYTVKPSERLPGGWETKRWALAELKAYGRGTAAQSVLVSQISAEGVSFLSPSTTSEGLGITGTEGPIPVFYPMPIGWVGDLTLTVETDTGTSIVARVGLSMVEVTEDEWNELNNGVGACP